MEQNLATWLRVEMAKRDINDTALARMIDTSHVAIGHWRRGERTPNYGNCIKLARVFDIPEEEILIIAGHRQPNIIGDRNKQISEARSTYHIDRRVHLNKLLNELTDDQLDMLIQFLESIK